MQIQNPNLTEKDSINLGSSIVKICSCELFFAAGTMDDSVRIWKNSPTQFQKQPIFTNTESISGISDITFTPASTHLAWLSIDSYIKIWDMDSKLLHMIEVPMFGAWRIGFVGSFLATCGDFGRIFFYDLVSREMVRRREVGDYFLTALDKSQSDKRLAVGNLNGDVYLIKTQSKDQPVHLKPHHKPIRSLTFTKDQQSLLSCSDDKTIALTDLKTCKTISKFEGHDQKVTCIKNHFSNSNYFYSCSTDKRIKLWDVRAKKSANCYQGNGALWTIQVLEKILLVGGEAGVMTILG